MISFIPLGGASEVGASSFYLNLNGTGILLDCGLHPRKKGKDSLPAFDLIKDKDLDFVFISHAHQDHIGAIPYLIKLHPHVRIFCTTATKELASIALHNAAGILEKEMNQHPGMIPYTNDEVDMLVKSIIDYDYGEEFELSGLLSSCTIKVSFWDAGHILGSASVLIESSEKTIFYTGDINFSTQQILAPADLPEKKIDILISESTYGAIDSRNLPDLKTEVRRFVKETNKVLADGGSILVPVFSLGKSQELLGIIAGEIIAGRLTDSTIYTGGLMRAYFKMYDKFRFTTRRKNKNFLFSDVIQENHSAIRNLNHFDNKNGIVLVSSGMLLEKTASFEMAKFWLNMKKFAIFIVGYMDESTPGFKIANSSRGEKIKLTDFSKECIVSCGVQKFSFPSHSRREDLIKMIDKLKPRSVILVHGEEDGINWMGRKLLARKNELSVSAAEVGKELIFN
ncbi:MAG: MBL fold metallo-hydrolase [Melioribacteraceae bacterium]|nr:MBL fold metallo-hydrolase [Melioribacteraceae bacterium]MCF8356130.1 MBL fold metallo-hydrolase [Melioribacteraceae bacterium]MCF8395478.1 MBL fold metallo-hydrolase [Melioribacteraceae bacterium]MCF8420818.1 MBL fold metallo-hydrolase [Melioribacteraceae bacterium]